MINKTLTFLLAALFSFSALAEGLQYSPLPTGNGNGSVTSVSVATANGVSGTVATSTSTPAITLVLGAITPTTIVASGLVTSPAVVSGGTTFTIASGCGAGGTAPSSLTGGSSTGSFVANATACSPVFTLPTAPNGWWCSLIDLTHPADTFTETAKSVTSCTMTVASAVTAADVLIFHAEAY